MVQHRGSTKKFFIYNIDKSKKKQVADKHSLVLNLKNMCFYLSKQKKSDRLFLKKIKSEFIKTTSFLLNSLLIDFNTLITQNLLKSCCLLFKITIEKAGCFLKKTDVFMKNSIYVFLPQPIVKE